MKVSLRSVVGLLLLMLAVSVQAHRYHFGLTEISINERTQSVEIVHRFFVADIERALQVGADKNLKDDEAGLKKYVDTHFWIKGAEGERLPLKWVGIESDVRNVWVYQELPLSALPEGMLRLRQSMLLEIEQDQVNTVNVTLEGKTTSHTLREGAAERLIQIR